MYHLSHGVSIRARENTAYKIATYFSGLLVLLAGMFSGGGASIASAQTITGDYSVIGGRYKLDRPSAMAVSPNGEKIAISDLATNRIIIIDLEGRLLWTVGEQIRLEQPAAVCFESDTRLLFTQANHPIVYGVDEYNAAVIDTVKNLSGAFDNLTIDQIIREPAGTYLILDQSAARLYRFDSEWEGPEIVVRDGSGKGLLLAPSYIATTTSGELVIADSKNFPVQVFASDGKFLYQCGWNQPSQQRGWEAVCAAVDSRGFIWAADKTNSQYRIFDQTGTELSKVPFDNSAVSPIAMVGTIDNRMAVLEETGRLIFYTLQ
ncbi:MAG: hypothetical protein AB1483_12020 [Candidatus Zixiibacteriota bacterium]